MRRNKFSYISDHNIGSILTYWYTWYHQNYCTNRFILCKFSVLFLEIEQNEQMVNTHVQQIEGKLEELINYIQINYELS